MNTPRILFLLLAAAITRAQAQDNPAPAPAAEPAQTEMQKWIATTDAQWQAAFKRDVTDLHDAELNKVKLLYLTSLDDAIKKASSAGDLDGAVALRNEQKRFGDTNVFPAQDEAGDAASVKQIRAAIRVQLAQVEKDAAVRTKALHAKYDAVLAQAQTQLTQRQRIDDALLVKAKREEVAAAWITPSTAAAVTAAEQTKLVPVTAGKPTTSTKGVLAAADPGRDVLPSMGPLGQRKEGAVVVTRPEGIMSAAAFRPPLAITYVLKTTNEVRLRYAADQIIFNWKNEKTELRIDGGPVTRQHRQGAGAIPVNKFITIRQVVLPDRMTISVDGKERSSWQADFSNVNQEIGIKPYGSTVLVKQVLVNQMK